ncbi:MAG TPA: serine/threonine-protein kinase, partial [Thermoanaerobaculia bacterium]|nr:serine/threonine-protein kinase [Thermoanaerobaculia bacterium]
MAQPPGTLIEGKYEILGKIREGGMGAIYKVRHRLLDEIRVVKVMRPQVSADEELKRRFIQEAKTATRLKHPNLGTIHDFALDEDGTAYLVMEFIEGVNFAELLALKGCPETGLALEIAHQALLALGYLHRRSVVHRDIAPDNLMLTHDQEGRPLVKLIDLGIAKALDKPIDLTLTGVFLGKLRYASPEQYGSLPAGEKLDGRSDLYCLGLVLYELMTGKRPYGGETAAELLKAHLLSPPIPFSESDPEGKVPPELRDAILKALEKKREDRFASAEDFDREILTIRKRFAPPEKLERTVAILSRIRSTSGTHAVTVTPSAQNRLDLRFAAKTTPHPSQPPLTTPAAAVDAERTRVDQNRLSRRVLRRLPRRRLAWIAVAGGLVALAAGLVLLRPRVHQGLPKTAVAAVETPLPAASAAAEPQAAAAPEPTAAPTPEPVGAEPVAAAAEEPARLLQRAHEARTLSGRARQNAERARAAELAPGLYDFGR